jgi:curved DNA-binding protein CbpA
MNQPRPHSHYDTLRVDRGASAEHVRTAYRRLAQAFHPDKHPGKPAAAAVMAQINQAYEVLSDPALRSAYDERLALEDARALAASPAVAFTPDRFGWGAWLVFATTSLAVLTVGYVLIATWTPAAKAPRAAAPSAATANRIEAEAGGPALAQPASPLPPPRP